MNNGKHFFPNAAINRNWHMDNGRTTTNIQKTTLTRQYNSTKQNTNSTRVSTKLSLKLCPIQARLGTYQCLKRVKYR